MSNEELVKKIQEGANQIDNMEQLYKQNYGYIHKIAYKYAYSKDDIEDLMQEAYFGLYEAVNRYENTAGVLFMTYAAYWIKQAIIRYQEENRGTVRIPSHMHYKVIQYKNLMSDYKKQLGRKPTNDELRWHLSLGIDQKALEDIKKAYHRFNCMSSLDEFIPGMDGDIQRSDTITDPNIDIENSVIDEIIEESKRTELWQIVKDSVTPEQNTVITARYRKSMTLEATGRIIGKTRDKARNLEAQALRKLRHPSTRRKLEEKFEVNYARVYRGSLTSFRSRWTSIVEDIAIKNLETECIQ